MNDIKLNRKALHLKNNDLFLFRNKSPFKFTILISILCCIMLFVSCNKEEDDVPVIEKEVPIDSLYFSCTINNELMEFKYPSADSRTGYSSEGVAFTQKLNEYATDTVLIIVSKNWDNPEYNITLTFCDSIIVDTAQTSFDIIKNKECLFKKRNYPFQFYSVEDYAINRSFLYFIGLNIKIHDKKNQKYYYSNINYTSNYTNTSEVMNEYIDSRINSVYQITKSVHLDSKSNDYYISPYNEILNLSFIEGTFKCKLYEEGDIENYITISDGVLRGCFL